MIKHFSRVQSRRFCRAALLCIVSSVASPALADHMGPSGVGGGALAVITPWTLDEGNGGLGFRLSYTRPQRRSDATLEALSAKGVDAHNTDYNLNASLGIAYGITHELTVSVEAPFVRRDNLRAAEEGDGAEQLGNVSGFGDASLLAKYRLTHSPDAGFALIGGIKLPTGSTHKRSDDGERLETEHQPGTGSWDPIVGAAAGTKVGALSVSVSMLYQFSGKGAQRTRLGDRLQGGVALSHHFGGDAAGEHQDSQLHHHSDELDEHDAEPPHSSWDAFVELGGEWEGRQKIADEVEQASGGSWIYAAPGVRFTSAHGWSAGAAVALPLWQRIRSSHPDNRYRVMVSLGRAF